MLVEKYDGNPSAEAALRKERRPTISLITVLELVSAISRREQRRGRDDWEEIALKHYTILTSGFKVLPITQNIAKRAGILRTKYRGLEIEFSSADAVILATAESVGAEVVTGGEHFKREWNKVKEVKVRTI